MLLLSLSQEREEYFDSLETRAHEALRENSQLKDEYDELRDTHVELKTEYLKEMDKRLQLENAYKDKKEARLIIIISNNNYYYNPNSWLGYKPSCLLQWRTAINIEERRLPLNYPISAVLVAPHIKQLPPYTIGSTLQLRRSTVLLKSHQAVRS